LRDIRLLIVLAGSLGLIVVGGVLVPAMLNMLTPLAERPTMAMAAETGAKAEVIAKAAEPLPPISPEVDRLSAAFREAAKRVKPAVVAVTTSQTVTAPASPFGDSGDDFLRRFFGQEPGGRQSGKGPTRKFQRQGLGSGIIVDPDGYILTNNHVVEEAQEISVHLADGREFKAKVVGADPPTDIAVIKIKADNLPVAQLGDSEKAEVGDWVIAIGAPFNLEATVTAGIISATGRSNVGIAEYEQFLQTDAAINPGNSGGPLINMRGQVIGVNTAIASRSGGNAGVGFAVPSNLAREVMKRIRETGHVTRGWLGVGIQRLTPELADSMKLKVDQGALISQVMAGGPAEKAGIKAGDVILEFAGKPVKTPSELQNTVAWAAPGTKADLLILRGGKRQTLRVTVEKRPQQPESPAEAEPGAPANFKDLGIEVGNITADATRQFGYKPGQGALITDVEAGGLGATAGLRPGMLILQIAGQKVGGVAEFREAVGKADLAKGIPMLVRAGDRQMFVLLKKR
jgi:serine protease Do